MRAASASFASGLCPSSTIVGAFGAMPPSGRVTTKWRLAILLASPRPGCSNAGTICLGNFPMGTSKPRSDFIDVPSLAARAMFSCSSCSPAANACAVPWALTPPALCIAAAWAAWVWQSNGTHFPFTAQGFSLDFSQTQRPSTHFTPSSQDGHFSSSLHFSPISPLQLPTLNEVDVETLMGLWQPPLTGQSSVDKCRGRRG
mmetsp:Transcript_54903/g.98616  ORF Transcript_54903/g.98616 Transcript_54903/m.98616 type:complete len:201 (+) Transcript_54903:385-987(+)